MKRIQFWWNVFYVCIPIIVLDLFAFQYLPYPYTVFMGIACGFLINRMYWLIKKDFK